MGRNAGPCGSAVVRGPGLDREGGISITRISAGRILGSAWSQTGQIRRAAIATESCTRPAGSRLLGGKLRVAGLGTRRGMPNTSARSGGVIDVRTVACLVSYYNVVPLLTALLLRGTSPGDAAEALSSATIPTHTQPSRSPLPAAQLLRSRLTTACLCSGPPHFPSQLEKRLRMAPTCEPLRDRPAC